MVDLPSMPDFDDSIFDEAAEEILAQGGYTPDFLTSPKGYALINETNRILQTALDEGLSQRVDPDFRAHLEQNTFIFSGFKTHSELEQVNNLLRDSDGNIVPFDKFKYEVTKLGEKVNHAHLHAEYNMAVQSAQMASKWKEFEKHKDIANLQYRTANDEKVRAEHAVLNGITLPFDDKFWNNYYPPLGWNCRCTVVEVLKDHYPETNTNEAIKAGEFATSKPAQKIFRFNPGKVEKIFPPKHPYFPKGCGECKKGLGANNLAYSPDNIYCQTCKSVKICLDRYNHKKEIPHKRPKFIEGGKEYDRTWNRVFKCGQNDGYIVVEDGHGENEKEQNINTALPLAKDGHKIELVKQEKIHIEGHSKKVKTRDANVDGEPWEFKITKNYENLRGSIKDKVCQGNIQGATTILVDIYKNNNFKLSDAITGIDDAFIFNPNVEKICVMLESQKYVIISKKYWFEGSGQNVVNDLLK